MRRSRGAVVRCLAVSLVCGAACKQDPKHDPMQAYANPGRDHEPALYAGRVGGPSADPPVAPQGETSGDAARAKQDAPAAGTTANPVPRAAAKPRPGEVTGTITAVSDRSITVSGGGRVIDLQVTPDTQVVRAGQSISATELQDGDEVRASFDSAASDHTASRITVVGAAPPAPPADGSRQGGSSEGREGR